MDSPSHNEPGSKTTAQPHAMLPFSDPHFAGYLKERDRLIDSGREAARSFDRWLLTLSGGALGLSMAFARDIAFPGGATGSPYLLLAWLALACALVLGLGCILASQRSHEDFRKKLDETLEEFATKGTEAGFWAEVRRKQDLLWSPHLVGWLNRFSVLAFMAGIVLLSVFACLNLPDKESPNGRKVDSTARIGQVVPQSPRASDARARHRAVQRSTADGAGAGDEACAGTG
ncbi:MAG TPA: hypothetical protein VMY37_13375 [Thermoguttaceae bacterium]|nr:hypothetical protein [Thermoguttaceae bacterium]